ncbi:hypothetical protein SUGI_0806520 [Cryptomeria japonica]|nr:hypothetical protein SUGI_0806520 [Cryptomeria japonica]
MEYVELDNLRACCKSLYNLHDEPISGLQELLQLSSELSVILLILEELLSVPFISLALTSLKYSMSYFLMKKGKIIYNGPLGHNFHKIVEYFEAIPEVTKIKDKYNPTWMLEASSDFAEVRLGIDFAEHYRNLSRYKFFFTLLCALLFGTIFWNVGTKWSNNTDLFIVVGTLYGAAIFLGITNYSTVQPVIAVERTVFYRERAACLYSTMPYTLGQPHHKVNVGDTP